MRAPWALVAALAALVAVAHAQFKSKKVNNPDIPATSFSCVGRHNGYYADVETDCQVYHMCLDRQQFSYQCPNTTRFQQRMMVCDHWYQVDCPSAPLAYSANLLIGQRDTPFVGDDEHRAIHEAAVRTSKGLLKGLSQPSANALDQGGRSKPPSQAPSPSPAPTRKPIASPPAPSSALELPFEDDEPQRGAFFQRSPTSSFAQPFQNQLPQQQQQHHHHHHQQQQQQQQQQQEQQQQQQQSDPQPQQQQESATGASTISPSTSTPPPSPAISFTFTPPSTVAPPRFSISFTPSPSFPASGHNLQRSPSFAPSAPSAPSAPGPNRFGPSASAPSAFAAFTPSAPAPTGPPVRTPSRELEVPLLDYPEPEGNDIASDSLSSPSPTIAPVFSPSPSPTFATFPTNPTFAPAFSQPQTFAPVYSQSPSTFAPTFSPSPTFSSPFSQSPTFAPAFSPSPPTSFSPTGFSPSTSPPFPAEAMTPEQSSSFASPFSRNSANGGIAEPSRELTPPHYFGSDTSAPGFGPPSALGGGLASAPASGPGSLPRPFSLFNSTQRLSLFAATPAPSASSVTASATTPAPPSRELEAPLDESEADFNTVELKFQDTRRLFFIPTSGRDSSRAEGLAEGQSDPVVVIKYPSKSTRGANGAAKATAHLKAYSPDVKRRVDPACPHCHPDFVVPGTCSPCVLLH